MEAPDPFDKSCLEALAAIGKAQSQLGLYSAQHPAVQAMIGEAAAKLEGLLQRSPGGEIAYSIDADKFLANGRIIGQQGQVPNSIPQFFSKFRLNSVIFKAGVTVEELTALCELASLRPDAAKATAPEAFLSERGVSHILTNEALYAKVQQAEEGPAPAVTGASEAEKAQEAERVLQEARERSIEDTITALVRMAVPDPVQQARIIEAVMQRVREDLRKQVEEATLELTGEKQVLANEQTRTMAVFETMAQGVVTVDDQGNVLMMNPEAEALFGTRLSEMAGKPLASGAKEDHLLSMAREAGNVPRDQAVDPSVEVVASDDARRTLSSSTAVVRNEAGKAVGMVSALSDKAKHRELEKKEREFVAHVTHELRAPLTSIRAALEIIADMGGMPADSDKIFQNAMRNTDRLEGLVNSILDFSKIESGQMTVNPARVDAENIISDAVESLRPWASKKGLRLETTVQPGLPPVDSDMPRTVQVLVNLLSNAIKFTPKGGRIEASLRSAGERAPGFVLFCVADSGPGIAKEEQERVFEKFAQIAAGERHVGGTGLGLSIAKALVVLQKGDMWVESELGRGARFCFTLPHHAGGPETVKKAARTAADQRSWWKRLLGLK